MKHPLSIFLCAHLSLRGSVPSVLLGALALGSLLAETGCSANDDRANDDNASDHNASDDSTADDDPADESDAAPPPFAVGTSTYEWIDSSRPEELTPEAGDVCEIVVRAWYPAAATSPSASSSRTWRAAVT